MAAQPLVKHSYLFPAATFKDNVIGTLNVLEAVRIQDLKTKVIVVTTDKVYKDLIDGLEEVMKKCEKAEKRCPRAGNSKASTLSDQQLRGKESLQRKEKAGELIMVASDKSGKNIPMSVDLYKSCMEAHIKDDSEHTHEEVAQVEKTLNGAATQILRIFKCGEDWGHEDRLKSACLARNNEIPSLNQLVKDHKETLQTRPVCRAKQAPNGNLGEIICNILDPFVEEADKTSDLLGFQQQAR